MCSLSLTLQYSFSNQVLYSPDSLLCSPRCAASRGERRVGGVGGERREERRRRELRGEDDMSSPGTTVKECFTWMLEYIAVEYWLSISWFAWQTCLWWFSEVCTVDSPRGVPTELAAPALPGDSRLESGDVPSATTTKTY